MLLVYRFSFESEAIKGILAIGSSFGSIYSAEQVYRLTIKRVRTAMTLVVMCIMNKMKAEILKEEASS
jgi:hypothetical protein